MSSHTNTMSLYTNTMSSHTNTMSLYTNTMSLCTNTPKLSCAESKPFLNLLWVLSKDVYSLTWRGRAFQTLVSLNEKLLL